MKVVAVLGSSLFIACATRAAPPPSRAVAVTSPRACVSDPPTPAGDDYWGTDWAGIACADGEQLGVLDSVVESPAWELLIVGRRGGGAFELRGRLRKVYYFAVVTDVSMNEAPFYPGPSIDSSTVIGVSKKQFCASSEAMSSSS
jgi:hypothetical protein